MKKTFFAGVLVLSFCTLALAADRVTLTTYYPAPFGMYQEMRVVGKLGVKTTDPQADLDVAGSIIVDGGSGDADSSGSVDAADIDAIKTYITPSLLPTHSF